MQMEDFIPVLKASLKNLLEHKQQVLVAIDGNCTAGKSTLASLLQAEFDCNVFHMDDFFLRPGQRTPERYAQPGGNVDYERFREEVLAPLQTGKPFSYRPFDCGSFTLSEPVTVEPRQLNIVEGTYSQHPYFGDVYDYRVFLSITPDQQRERILRRPLFLHRRFFEEWIPMEQMYFDHFRIPDQCDLQLNTNG